MYSKFSSNPKTTKRIFLSILILCSIFFIQKFRTPLYLIPEREHPIDSNVKQIESDKEIQEIQGAPDLPLESETVIIYLTGEVKKPGIVELNSNMRLKDALEMVGGFTEEADINSINLAERVQDERHYVVYKIGESVIPPALSSSSSPKNDVVNINTAQAHDLKQLDGIGDALAERIITYRNENGNFSSIEDIKNVSGIGEKKFEAIKDHISIR